MNVRRDSETNCFQPQTGYMREKVAEDLPFFFGPEPSYWDEAGIRPIQARTEHAAGTWGAEGASCVLCLTTPAAVTPKDWGV